MDKDQVKWWRKAYGDSSDMNSDMLDACDEIDKLAKAKLRERITILVIVLAVATLVYVLVTPLGHVPMALEEERKRNPWGQHLPLDMNELCEGTVLQWSAECVRRKEGAEE